MCIPAPSQAIILSTSHNDGSAYSGATARWSTAWLAWIAAIQTRCYSAGIVALTQNPRNPAISTGLDWHDEVTQIQKSIPQIAKRSGIEVIDTRRAFSRSPLQLSTLIQTDGIHPTIPFGEDVILNEVWRVMGNRTLY
jgi:lysophospholipase L1-like esterase